MAKADFKHDSEDIFESMGLGKEVTETKMFMQVTTIIAMMETVIIMEREVEVQIILVTELEVVEKVQVFIHLLVRNMKLQ